jgi:NAD(P)-dependent dehydrogenase (short-subunit alcohol dehydrogenase family)
MSERLAVVTGTSTGIGASIATALAGDGYEVLAGVRRAGEGPPGATEVRLDVTDPEAIDRLAATVGDRPLAALVNNAGIAVPGPVEAVPLDSWRAQFEVNLFGQIAVTQALLGALRSGGGRLVNISSIGGRLAGPGLGAYSASKWALEAVSDALRRELAGEVDVIVIEPGAVRTPIWDRGTALGDALIERFSETQRTRYAPLLDGLRRTAARNARTGVAPEVVARVVLGALAAPTPRTRYLVGRDAAVAGRLARVAPDRLLDRLTRRNVGL